MLAPLQLVKHALVPTVAGLLRGQLSVDRNPEPRKRVGDIRDAIGVDHVGIGIVDTKQNFPATCASKRPRNEEVTCIAVVQ